MRFQTGIEPNRKQAAMNLMEIKKIRKTQTRNPMRILNSLERSLNHNLDTEEHKAEHQTVLAAAKAVPVPVTSKDKVARTTIENVSVANTQQI
jgi:hypothetical protein